MKEHKKYNEPDVLQELKEISPFLASIGKGHPFRVPEGYFEAMEQSILSIVAAESIAEVKSDLAVPENYFEELPQQILNKISERNNDLYIQRVKPLWAIYRMWLAAASVALVTGLYFIFFSTSSLRGPADPFASIEWKYETAESYLYANLDDVDETTLIQLLSEEESNQAGTSEEIEPVYDEYLIDLTDVDPELLSEI